MTKLAQCPFRTTRRSVVREAVAKAQRLAIGTGLIVTIGDAA